MDDFVYGRNPALESLKSGRPVNKLLIARGAVTGPVREIMALAREQGLPVQQVDRKVLDTAVGNTNHQGVLVYLAAKEYVELEDILAAAAKKNQPPFILALDEITDPHNLGALLRTADAAGVHGVVIPKRRAVGLTGVVAKTAAGALEHVDVARVANLTQALNTLKEAGCWVVGADMTGPDYPYKVDLRGPLVIVIGGEHKGLGRLIRDNCDLLVKLPMVGHVPSLNAGVAGSILMYEALRQRMTTDL
ncbi:MAG TPA: 23S rRNA (guanosine(2251)-2'-O)-methyltransferase RlmB [Desulfobacteria bacterium]|nr:23S rRNA (guanosine(2251)-2'-O)-methyltransferase RlmB [Desulfobacteria bacterium]